MVEEGSTGLALELDRVLPAPPDAVFAAFTNPKVLRRWWGPEGFTILSLDFEPRAGTQYRIEMRPPEGKAFYLSGELREVDPPARLVFSFVWEDPDPDDIENVTTLSFRDLGDSTEVFLRQAPFKTEARRALHDDGWSDSFDKLDALLRLN